MSIALPKNSTDFIKKSVIKSQHTQRNWDLSRKMPTDDIETLIHAATNCPSKQNFAFYKIHVITDRDLIQRVYENTGGITFIDRETGELIENEKNSQTLAHCLIVFEDVSRSDRYVQKWKNYDDALDENWQRDQHMAVGIAAGYLNVVGTMLGYGTGCCACGDFNAIGREIGLEKELILMMGIGIGRTDVNRRIHQESGMIMPTHKKEPIQVVRHGL